MTHKSESKEAVFKIFKNKDYTSFTGGYACYWLSYSFELFLIGAIVWQLTENPAIVSLVYGLELFPSLIFGPLLSTLADKFNRIRIIRVSIIVKIAKISLVILALILEMNMVFVLCLASFIDGIITAADEPALHSTVVNLVKEEEISQAVSINGAISFISLVIGPAICSLILIYFSDITAYTSALLFSCAYLAVWLSIPERFGDQKTKALGEAKTVSIFRQIADGAKYLRDSGLYIYVLLIALNAVLVRSFFNTPSIQSGYFFDGSVEMQAQIAVSIGIGMVLGSLLAVRLSQFSNIFEMAMGALGLVAMSYLLSSIFSSAIIYGLFWVIYGVGFSVSLNLGKAALQTACLDEFRGRVSGVISYIPRGLAAVATPLVGVLIVGFGLKVVLAASATLIVFLVVGISNLNSKMKKTTNG